MGDQGDMGRCGSRRQTMDNEPLVQCQSLTKRYGAVEALVDCTLQVGAGQVFGLLGPNGSGKTTLLRLLMGFLRPTAGRATIGGLDCYRDRVRVHRLVSYLPGDVRLFSRMRGRQVLRLLAEMRAGSNLERAERIAEFLELDLRQRVARMSTGMRQKLALCAALSPDVPLLILDEPTAALDPTARARVLELIAEAAEAGRAVLFSSHVLSEVEEVCQDVAILRRGRVVHVQSIGLLRQQHRIRARLAGPPPAAPESLARQIEIQSNGQGDVVIQTRGELSPVLSWLATLPVQQMQVEPVGLRSIYQQYHAGGA